MALVAHVEFGPGIKRRCAPDQLRIAGAQPQAHEAAHAEARCSTVTAVRECAVSGVDVRDQLLEVFAEIVVAAVFHNFPRRAAIETGVIARHVTVHRNHNRVVMRHEASHFGNGVGPVVVFLERVAIAVAVEIIDHRIAPAARFVIRRQQDAVVALLAQSFREVLAVVERLRGGCRGHRRGEEKKQLQQLHGLSIL